MKVVGLITEYNPFHFGHMYHVQKSKEITGADYCVVVMSGNYVQRGEPAIVDKWTRSKIALQSGIDAVIELPVHYATASAEFFALASISLLQSTGIVDSICFGSESGEVMELEKIADALNNPSPLFQSALEMPLKNGLRFPVARAMAIEQTMGLGSAQIISSPNNILGIEYIKALKRLNSDIKPYTIKRLGAAYHDSDAQQPIASATAIRKQLSSARNLDALEKLLPQASYVELSRAITQFICPVFLNDFFPLLKYKLLTTTPAQLSNILDVTEGFENRIIHALQKAHSYTELLELLATKRYTNTKISRALLHILLDITKDRLNIFNNNGYAQYIRILGFQLKSQCLMQSIKKNSSIPLIVNVKDSIEKSTSLQKNMLLDEIRSTHIYNTVVCSKTGVLMKNDYTQPIITL